jgi:hypothetical protein
MTSLALVAGKYLPIVKPLDAIRILNVEMRCHAHVRRKKKAPPSAHRPVAEGLEPCGDEISPETGDVEY